MKKINSTIEIKFDKRKIFFSIMYCIGFVVLSLLIWNTDYPGSRYKIQAKMISIISIPLLLIGVVWLLIKLFDSRPGIVINEKGIQINDIGAGMFIAWENIIRIDTCSINSTRCICIFINNTEEFIQSKNIFIQINMRIIFRSCGSPIVFITYFLSIEFDKLYKLLSKQYELHKIVK